MIKTETAAEFLRAVKKFNQAMEGPSTDAEVDAACAMRDCALAILEEGSTANHSLRALMAEFEK
jgi:hypothetical protein